jgi:hypothetical protein
MIAPAFAWLVGVSDAFPARGGVVEEAEEAEEEEDYSAAVQLMIARLPVCAETCEDGELFYETLCAWAVPWSKAPLAAFLPAWFRVPVRRRRHLLRKHMCFTDELCVPKKKRMFAPDAFFPRWVDGMCARDDARMFRALAALEKEEEEEEGGADHQGGVLSRASRRARKDDESAWERALVHLCVDHGAVGCLAAWAQSRNWPPGNWPDGLFVDNLQCARRGQTAVLRLLAANSRWLSGTTAKSTNACATAAYHGQLECLRYLCEEAGYEWCNYSVWNSAERGGHAACMDYLGAKGCPTRAPPPPAQVHLQGLLAAPVVSMFRVIYRQHTNFALDHW